MKKKELTNTITLLLTESNEPLETKEIIERLSEKFSDITRAKTLYRLMLLRGDGLILGKSVGSGKGVWIWWRKE